ncbi:iron-sulfur cluster assembly protein [Thermoflexus sp.]|uniref:metal-sulfur cluster assembly factor n=1 Tax=Thermoflexus sp. TaxID=1969742 RepID=UPI002ADE781E|nr:iron-sulfur cluster assembly protein [Thermoflexus sp.]
MVQWEGTEAGVQASLWQALDEVLDPELDQSIVRLGFVEAVLLEGSCVEVTLRLPTFWCAPNFVFMMAEDIRRALLQVEGVQEVRVRIADHFASEAIEAAIREGRSFEAAFPGEATGSLDELRQWFQRKGYLSRQFALLKALRAAGFSPPEICAMRLADLLKSEGKWWARRADGTLVRIESEEAISRYLKRRQELGLDGRPESPLMLDMDGNPIPLESFEDYLRRSRTTLLNLSANASLCQALLASRKGGAP